METEFDLVQVRRLTNSVFIEFLYFINMKVIFSFLAVCLLILSSCSKKTALVGSANNELKVLTYNIHHGNPPSIKDSIDLDAIVRVIKKENPDVIAMQELDRLVNRSGRIDEVKDIARKIGMNYHFFKTIDYDGGEYGIAIFSKLTINNPRQVILPKAREQSETRALGYVEIKHASGQKIIFACTHLCTESEASRTMQVKAIQEELSRIKHPIVLCGDLNSTQGSKSISLLQQEFRNSCTDNCGFTVPAVNPRRNIDFILTKNANWQVKDYHVVDESYASDHRPVAATFYIHK